MAKRRCLVRPTAAKAIGTAVLLLLLLHLQRNNCTTANGKEIVATNEWQLLGENDTVDSGLHIRIDMTTGEKWAKLADTGTANANTASASTPAVTDNDEHQRKHEQLPIVRKSTSSHQAMVRSDGLIVVDLGQSPPDNTDTEVTDADPRQNNNNNDATTNSEKHYQYDFDMMHRTLSQLPDEEKERMQLPPLPKLSVSQLSAEARKIFQEKMKQIWESRQEELRQVQLDLVADMPQILKDRIASIRSYLEDPIPHLLELLEDTTTTDRGDKYERNDGGNETITNIVSVLADLEYHLSDVDMARDFHTLGGWSLTASLLSDTVHAHHSATSSNSNTITTILQRPDQARLQDATNRVQTQAAWALGTAVKNTGEFTPFVMEEIVLADNVKTTALDLVVQQFQQATMVETLGLASSNDDKQIKLLYCLGSFLRGNRAAQIHFGALQGPALLAQVLQRSLDEENTKLARRLLQLAYDIVTDNAHFENNESDSKTSHVNVAIVASFSSMEWCTVVVNAAHVLGLEEAALVTIRALAPYCSLKHELSRTVEAVTDIQNRWKSQNNTTDNMDPDVLASYLELADAALEELRRLME